MLLRGYRAGELTRRTIRKTIEDNCLGVASQIAFNFFFLLFPLMLFTAPLLSLIGDKRKLTWHLIGRLAPVFPPDAHNVIHRVITDVVSAKNVPGLISIGAVLAAWSGTSMFTTVMHALETAYRVKDERPWWKKRLLSLAVLAGWVITIALVIAVLLAGDNIVSFARTQVGAGSAAVHAWEIIQVPLAIVLLVAFFYLMYWLLPYVKQDKRQILVGSVVAALLFLAATLAFRLYVNDFPPNKTYGTIGAVIVLLTWMYAVSLMILVGGELNSELHHGTEPVASGKGSVYAGRLAPGEQPAQASGKIE
jgi:membrane protein